MNRLITPRSVFILLIYLSAFLVLLILFPDTGIIKASDTLILLWLHALCGMGLVVVTCKEGISGKARSFLLLTGLSADGFGMSIVMQNGFYALGTLIENLAVLNTLMNYLEFGFFLITVIVCPIGLLIGVIGTLVLWKKLDPKEREA